MEPKRHNTRHAAARAAAAAENFSSPSPSPPRSPQDSPKNDMYDSFQSWALKTYGDSAKTKTVTRRKYNRILKILKGEEQTSAENSKFRFWVKAKGFRIGPPHGHVTSSEQILYIPCSKVPTGGGERGENMVYKKVAVVENFYDIIYGVHVEMDGRGGKHAGQKRTYKAIAEMYSFLPREAVTHFLMSCTDCQKRMHLGAEQRVASSSCHDNGPDESLSSLDTAPGDDSLHIDYSLPITTTYLKHMRSLGYSEEDALNPDRELKSGTFHFFSSKKDKKNHIKEDVKRKKKLVFARLKEFCKRKREETEHPNLVLKNESNEEFPQQKLECQRKLARDSSNEDSEDVESEVSEEANPSINPSTSGHLYDISVKEETSIDSPTSAGPSRRKAKQPKHERSLAWSQESMAEEPINMIKGDFTNNHHDHSYERTASPCNGCTKREASSTPDNLSAGTKDEDDEDDDDDSDKIDMNKYDPERLKAFNMFVRLFVDENLDRMVPISRQPKDKIQAIIDSCSRQFPEFGERARKRIRTYLKSCRRNKRTRENSNWEMGRNTQPHLTSALAEQILASACENESQNAKRMRLGLKPISADVDRGRSEAKSPQNDVVMRHAKCSTPSLVNGTQSSSYSSSSYRLVPNNTSNGHSSSLISTTNGPTDLSMKKGICNQSNTVKHSLNPSEVIAVKQLIAGYRESAAFLLRSADELEQLLVQQN